MICIADGARLHQVFPVMGGAEALSFTDGLFDAAPEALKLAAYRLGAEVERAEIVPYDKVEKNGRCPGLLEDFFAGRAPTCPAAKR